MKFKAEPTETEGLFKVTELREVQTIDEQVMTIEGESWIFSKESLQNEIDSFQEEIDKRKLILTKIGELE